MNTSLNRYSKQRLLDNARAIQANNNQMYVLTDSAKMIEASMAGIRNYGSVTLQSMHTVMAGRQSLHNRSAGHLPTAHRNSEISFGDSVTSGASASMGSAGELTGADDVSHDGEHDHTGKFTEPRNEDDEEGAVSDLDGEEESVGEQDTFAEPGPPSVPTVPSPTHGNSVATGTADEQSVGGSTFAMPNPSQLSPVAPAPSHIDQSTLSGENLEAHLQSALSMAPLGPAPTTPHASGTVDTVGFSSIDVGSSNLVGHPPLEGSQTVSDLLSSPSGNGTGTHHALKHSDTAALRVKEIKDRITSRAPSVALEEFQVTIH